MMNEINIEEYKNHPRILELQMMFLRESMVQNYGEGFGLVMLERLANETGCNWSLLAPVFTKSANIRKVPGCSNERYKQTVVFMGHIYGENRKDVAQKYLGMSSNYLYQMKDRYSVEEYVTNTWLLQLDRESVLAHQPAYKQQVERFLTEMKRLKGAL